MLVTALLVLGPNLLKNGDFEQGNHGFQSQYQANSSIEDTGTYAVCLDPHSAHQGAFSMTDHSGTGQMLAANGSMVLRSFWSETVTVSAHKTYTFSGWLASWSWSDTVDDHPADCSPAQISLHINGKLVGSRVKAERKSGVWRKFSVTWKSGSATTAKIELFDSNYEGMGNDFAVDDLFFGLSR